ncbi:thioesterase family protein [Caballeronia sp. dw_19]|uniref:acyl-CoA thioesterase n=1 Tax=Caballeronia sp. dw_19 TaxID=2719791 RepID=UPI003211A7FA
MSKDAYPVLRDIDTRWMDNDAYGHVNNVVYYSYFDTAVNAHLLESGALGRYDAHNAIGLVVETQCCYFASASFPDRLTVGLRVARIGTSSVRYELAIFPRNEPLAIAQGHFVHVYVDRETQRPVTTLPGALRDVLDAMTMPG